MSLNIYLQTQIDLGKPEPHTITLWQTNITHNYGKIAHATGTYQHIWKPQTKTAKDLIQPLQTAINKIQTNPQEYAKLNPPNNWGTHTTFLQFLKEYHKACTEYPKATITTTT
jgi:hypothetical protein